MIYINLEQKPIYMGCDNFDVVYPCPSPTPTEGGGGVGGRKSQKLKEMDEATCKLYFSKGK